MVRRLLFVAPALGFLSLAPLAAAAPTAHLVYSRASDAESCPDETALRRAVAARVGYDPFFAWAQRTVVASVVRRDRTFVASVDLIDEQGIAHGARELRAEDECGELLDAVALAIAIAIDPQSLSREPVSATIEAAPNTPEPPPETRVSSSAGHAHEAAPAEAPPRPSAPSGSRTVAIEPSIGAVASAGVAHGVVVGAGIGAAVRWRNVSAALEGRIDAPTSIGPTPGPGEVSSWLVVAALVPCAYVGPWLGCAVVQGGSMQTWSSGVHDTRSQSVAWWAAGARTGVLVPLSEHALLRARVDALVDLSRPSLYLNGRPVWTTSPLAASLGLDAVLRFP